MRRLPSPIALLCALALALTATLATPRAARATLMEALDLATLVDRSDDVVVARAVRKSSRWMGERIVTDVVLEISEVAKGDRSEGEALQVLLLGGAVGELGMRVAGEAGLEPGHEYLLFLRRWNGTSRPVGMAQGALPVQRSGGEVLVQPAGGDLSLVRREPSGALTHAEPAVTEARPLADLLAAIRNLAGR
jgi:hypothetical protein